MGSWSTNNSFDLRGKEYFTVEEAAHYACVSIRKLMEYGENYGIISAKFMGRDVYRRSDIDEALERCFPEIL